MADDKVSQRKGVEERRVITNNPLVSIITPVLNGIKYLEECVQSVLSQSYPHIEQIFIDGGSSDGTLDMLSSYKAKYPDRIRFVSEPDRGPEDAWNKGLTMAKGEILGWLGSDDVYEPDAITTVVGFFKSKPDAYFVFGGCDIINEAGEVIRKFQTKDFNLKEAINDKCQISATSAFYRRKVIEKVGFIDTSTRISELDYWVRVGKVFQIHRIDKPLSNLRVHKDSFSGSIQAARAYVRDGLIISRRHGGSIFSPRCRRYFLFVILDRLGLYCFVNFVVLPKLRCPPFIDRVLRMLGG